MSVPAENSAIQIAANVYGNFLIHCVVEHVSRDREGIKRDSSGKAQMDGRPVRLVTISGKGGYDEDPVRREQWKQHENISLLDHLLSVARGALMFCLADGHQPGAAPAEDPRLYALVCIAFLHDIDKDLGLPRGQAIPVADVAERMRRYGINDFLKQHGVSISPDAMLNYIEEVETTQAARSPCASDYDRRFAAVCRYVEVADQLEGTFHSRAPEKGVDGVISALMDPNRWPALQNEGLRRWEKVEIHDPLHVFLLDRFQRALSEACAEIAGSLPLIEIVHDGRLLCVIPRCQADEIKARALERFAHHLHAPLRFVVNNRLACRFVGALASWERCRAAMDPHGHWNGNFRQLLSLPKAFAQAHKEEINALFDKAGMAASWSPDAGAGATIKLALDHPGGDAGDLDMAPGHALAFLVIALNHQDHSSAVPSAEAREKELLQQWAGQGKRPPDWILAADPPYARRILLALWTLGEIWESAEDDPDAAQDFLDASLGRGGLAGLWLDGDGSRAGLSSQIEDTSSEAVNALRIRFAAYLSGHPTAGFDAGDLPKRCLLCSEPVSDARKISSADRAHGVKISAFSGRDGRNDHLASPAGDTHLCPVCLKELQLRQQAQAEFRGGMDLPPLVSSPVTTGLFGGLAFWKEGSAEVSMGLHDLARLDQTKGAVYHGLDCQTRRIRIARLERLPETDKKLVDWLCLALKGVRRLGRPLHVFRGAPCPQAGIFYCDSLPAWLERLLGGNSLRIEQLPAALSQMRLFAALAEGQGLGVQWAKQLADPGTELGALCVAWALAVDRRNGDSSRSAWSLIEHQTRERALAHIGKTGGNPVNLKNNPDPLIQLAWRAAGIQRRVGSAASANDQRLCWKVALSYYMGAQGTISVDRDALALGLASTLEESLLRGNNKAAHRKHREGKTLSVGCIEFAEYFVDSVWKGVFGSKDPTLQEQRRAGAIYRFALLEAYRERGIPETDNGASGADQEGVK